MQIAQPYYSPARPVANRLELRPNESVSVPAKPGTLVRCEKGPIWLTQEGQREDYILLEGMRFVSGSRGKIVLSAPDGAVEALVYHAGFANGLKLAPGLHVGHDVIERVAREARHAQMEAISHLLGSLATTVRCTALALARRLGFAPRWTC